MADDKVYSVAIYETDEGTGVTVHCEPENVWLTQTEVAEVFGTGRSNVTKHIQNIISEGELEEEGNVKKIHNGFNKPKNVYSLDVVLAVGYRVSSQKATRFRKWATEHLKAIATEGYSVDEDQLIASGAVNELYEKLRSIRVSESNLYTKVRDVFKESSSDYEATSQAARSFFSAAQDKFHYAVTEKTAAEIVLDRADGEKPDVGMRTFKGKSPTLQEVKVAKNYLSPDELRLLENISEQFLLFAESKAFRGQKMTMEELATKLNVLLMANDYPVLYEYKSFLAKKRDDHAKAELGKYRTRMGELEAKEKPKEIQ